MKKKSLQKRTKIQWVFYFKKNVFLEYPSFFSKLTHKKWKFLKKNVWGFYKKYIFKYKSPLHNKKRLCRRKHFFKYFLKEKQLFKKYYEISSEKKFKKILRVSLKKKRSKLCFYSLLQQRIDQILVRVRYVPNLKIARFLIKKKFIYLNDRLVYNIDQIVKKNDILSIDFQIKKYIFNNIQKKLKKKKKIKVFHFKRKFKKKLKKKKRRKKKFFGKRKKLRVPKIFEINYKTLDLLFYKNFTINHFKIANDLSIDIVRRTYRR